MHQPLGDALVEDGMVAPGLSSSLMHQDIGYSFIPESPSSSKASKPQFMRDETANTTTTMASIDAQPAKENNGTCIDGHTHDFLKHENIIEEPETEMEGFIMRENDIDVIQEPVAEIDSLVKGAADDYKDLQPLASSDRAVDVIANESFAPQKRRVHWSDDHGKELFRVLEYEARPLYLDYESVIQACWLWELDQVLCNKQCSWTTISLVGLNEYMEEKFSLSSSDFVYQSGW